ncbi:hypothetical protein Tco_0575475, partial [Tanacetum coccineum]
MAEPRGLLEILNTYGPRSIRHEVPRYIGVTLWESAYSEDGGGVLILGTFVYKPNLYFIARNLIEAMVINALGYSIFRCNSDLGLLQIGIRAKVIENQQSCLHQISCLYQIPQSRTRLFHLRTYHYFGMEQPDSLEAAPQSPIQAPPVPQDEDKREPMFIQPLDPDNVPKPIYPEYIPLEDEHDPEEDPEEYEDDETEDGPVDYPVNGGDDGDDDDGDSFGDDTDDEDEDMEEEEEEEHLAPADSAIIVPTIKPVSPPEGTEPIIPPPSTNITTTGARIIVRLQASISLPLEAEVERLLAMPTPSPSPPISLSPPSAGERLARCMAPSAHSSPPPVPSPLLLSSGCPTQIQTLSIASTQDLIHAATAALPSHPLPPLPPSLYILPPVDRREDVPESELPPRKRSCLSTLGP